jgi:hypothetical protein
VRQHALNPLNWNCSQAQLGSQVKRTNPLPTRLQSPNKRNATREFVNNALATGLIEPSQAESWSQILLTPKANGKWRFCLDYRTLNKYTKTRGWPIPNIICFYLSSLIKKILIIFRGFFKSIHIL